MPATDYIEIGHYLRDSRESLRVTREDAARALHIRAKYLAALETGDLSDMPGKAYMRGYIRTYAEYLGLDAEQVLEAYAPLLGGPRAQDLFIPEPTLAQNLPSHRLIWLTLLGLLLLYGGWYFTLHDRTETGGAVPAVPPGLAHLLDKSPVPGMDKPWGECLSGGYAGCYAVLRAEAPLPRNAELYDIQPNDTQEENP